MTEWENFDWENRIQFKQIKFCIKRFKTCNNSALRLLCITLFLYDECQKLRMMH